MKRIFNVITFILSLPFLVMLVVSIMAISFIVNDAVIGVIGKKMIESYEKVMKNNK